MPSKQQTIMEMAAREVLAITSGAGKYMAFLTTAANNYKYRFQDQLLIHAQKPSATACAEIETWNRLGRWVNKGTRGIALLVDRDMPYKLRHVFDVSDTNSRAGRTVSLWRMERRYQDAAVESLGNSFGEVEHKGSFAAVLIDTASLVVEDNITDYYADLCSVKEGSFLEELDELNTEVWFRETLKSSVAFMLLTRCGYDAREYLLDEDFSRIYDFNTPETISVLGAAVSDISEMVLRDIEKTVKSLAREEKKPRRTFARGRDTRYADNRNRGGERSVEYGADLYQTGRLPDSRSDSAGGPAAWKIWNVAAQLSPQAPERDLHRDDAVRQAEQPSGGDRPAGRRDGGEFDRADGAGAGRDGAPESVGSDALGAEDEQHPGIGGGDRADGTDLPVSDPAPAEKPAAEQNVSFPTVEEQQERIAEAEAEQASAFSISQEDIDAVLIRGGEYHEGKLRIYEQFLRKQTAAENIELLKDEYGISGMGPALPSKHLDVSYDGKGMKLTLGSPLSPDASVFLRWSKVEKRIGELIAADRYLNRAERERYPAYRAEQQLRAARHEIGEEFRSIISDYKDFVQQLGEQDKTADRWYLVSCASAFSIGDKKMYARTSDGDFILPMMRDAMQTIIAENTHLTERCEAMLTALQSDVAKPLEPTWDELNPPPEPKKEYRFSLGDTVYLGAQEYEILAFDAQTVRLFDPSFPLFNQELPREDFDRRLAETPQNDHLLQVAEDVPDIETHSDASDLDEAKRLINAYCMEVFESEANFSDLSHVDLAYSTTKDKEHHVAIYADLEAFRLVYQVDEVTVCTIQCRNLGDLNDYLGSMVFDEMITFAEEQYNRQLPIINEMRQQADQQAKTELEPDNAPEVLAAFHAYNRLKEQNPEYLVAVQVGDHYETYGSDAVTAGGIWESAMRERRVPGAGSIEMTGFSNAAGWQSPLRKLWRKGVSPLFAGLNENSEYEIVKQLQGKDYVPLGAPVTIDGREFVVDSVDFASGRVNLRDNTFESATAFPIFRSEDIDFVHDEIGVPPLTKEEIDEIIGEVDAEQPLPESAPEPAVKLRSVVIELGGARTEEPEPAEQAIENLAPPTPPARPRTKVSSHVLHPEIPDAQRHNFSITDDALGHGGLKTKYQANVEAIRTLQQIEQENRLATPEEQEILSRYVGWGGLPQAFDENNGAWANEYLQLKTLLTPEEYTSARASTLNAHYTSPTVIKAIYKAVENMGFQTGNILEPSCGVGNFFGLVPESMAGSKLYGVELDSLTGRMAQHLYQKSSIAVQGFETAALPDSFFDLAVGNVPFGSYKLSDKRYDKHNFMIHDYFFAKTLDKVRPGGIVAFVTSKGTMDKKNPAVRKYIAQRAELLGAIRLPNIAFQANANTKVTTDILFLQKRDRLTDIEPSWVQLGQTESGVPINQYYLDNPDMVLGEMAFDDMMYGSENETTCNPFPDADFSALLEDAIANIHGEITEYELDDLADAEENRAIPADPDVRNFSYAVVGGQIYYRENSVMNPVEVSTTAEGRIKGMIAIRDCVRTLIEYQTEDYPDGYISAEQQRLNTLYDAFVEKYGRINSRANSSAFSSDSAYFLLCSLEVLDDERNFVRKADMFSKRTIRQRVVVTSVDTASEALALSLAEKASVDMAYMSELTGKTEQELYADLTGVIFYDFTGNGDYTYRTADEFLSGNVREKLAFYRKGLDYTQGTDKEHFVRTNIAALEAVQPTDLTASEISVRLGAAWLPEDVVAQFMFELFDTPNYAQWNIKVHHSQYTGEWNIEGKSYDKSNIKAFNTYGTERINGYKIIEETLNLRDVRIFDYHEDANGRRVPVLNKKETAIAQGKQQLIKQAFLDWIWTDPQRRERLCKLYNEKYNSIRPREYDGSHLNFVGMNPEITLRPHQVNAIAHILYGGNTLLAHVVGAGKTFEMVAAAQESKRLGLCQKSLFVVPNHLTEQWAAEYLQLYPSANILVATRKDFETKNRKKFCGRIATGDYDAIIIGHSQFEKIPMSLERQRYTLEQQMDEILAGIRELKANRGDNFSIKQMERTKKITQAKLDKLNDQSRKDDVVTFEELGVDRIFVDEAHYYKNLAAFSKMRNVGGISQTEAQKSSDLYMKCRYLDEITDGRGVVFATGTPISNTMVEMYTMQKYLQYATLKRSGLIHFDSWASTFGETVTAIELAPEGSGYRAKTRFARFYNLPELMSMFKEVADIQTADMLNLPVPKANYHNIVLKPSEHQKEMVASLSERAERVRNRMVDAHEDNMLLITNDGRKLALDQRLINPMLPDSETSKTSACADNVFEIWQRMAEQRSTQMVFCDLSTPQGDGKFNVYDDLRDKLIAKGIPAEEIAYIHSASTEAQKKELFGKVRSGQIRVLLGSTQKMGAGTNVQQKLIALHHLDCPWRPADLQQREGRIIRQGNENPAVDIHTYVTENTFDSYLYQLVENKQKFIGQVMTSKSPARSAEDIDETALSYAEIKALCTGNPYIKEKMGLDTDVQRLKLLKSSHLSQKYTLEDKIIKEFPQKIAAYEQRIAGYSADMAHLAEHTKPNEDGFSPMEVEGVVHTDKKAAGSAILAACKAMTSPDAVPLGQYRGFAMELSFDSFAKEFKITLKNELRHTISLGTDIYGNILRLDNLLGSLEEKMRTCIAQLEDTKIQLANAKIEADKPFPQEDELKTKLARLDELNILLNLDKRENEIVDGERDEDMQEAPGRDASEWER